MNKNQKNNRAIEQQIQPKKQRGLCSLAHSLTCSVERGFTIVETLIALTLFSIAAAGVITASVQGGMNINVAKNSMTASYLAQEGIELMRAHRDTMVLGASDPATGWADFVTEVTSTINCTSNTCDIDPTNPNTVIVITSLSSPNLYYNKNLTPTMDAGYYSHDSSVTNTETPFVRTISAMLPAGAPSTPTEIEITSTVSWKEGSQQKSITMKENLFNWYAP